jgi:hypothetical protein
LRLIEPWLAQGKPVGRVTSVDNKWTGAVLHVDRARLMIPLPLPQPDKSASARLAATGKPATASSSQDTLFVVAGIPESSQAFLLSPAVLRSLPLQRVAGGTRIALPSPDDGFVLITEDAHVIQVFRQRVASQGANFVRAQRDFANQEAALITSAVRRAPKLGQTNDALRRAMAVNMQLAQIDPLLTAGRIEQAHSLASSAVGALRQISDDQRRIAIADTPLDSNPLAVSDETLPECADFENSLATLSPRENLLYGGDFEDLVQMTEAGWRHESQELPGVVAGAELSAGDPRQGRFCLELRATTADAASETLSHAPVLITSPAVPVGEGQAVEISGWVRIDGSISGEELQIIDSLGGPELSLAVAETEGWQPFRMVRGVPRSTELRLSFVLAGIGCAKIDAIMVRPLRQPMPRRLPEVPDPLANVNRGVSSPAAQPSPAQFPPPPLPHVESVNVPPLDAQPQGQSPEPDSTATTNVVNGPLFVAPQTR